MRLLEPMLRNLLRAPLRTVVVDDQRAWRGIVLYIAAHHLARRIAERTERPRIGLLLPTSGLMPLAILATWILGRTIVPINYLLSPKERDHIIEDAELDLIITVTPMVEHFGPLPQQVKQIRLDGMSFKGLPRLRPPVHRGDDHVAALLYTSGTSGQPKGVMLTVANLAANITQCVTWGQFPRRTVFLGVLPQFHCFGLTVLTLLPLYLGAKAVYTARFVPRKVLALLRDHRPQVFLAIPSMLSALLHAKDAAREHFAPVRYLISGGEPLPPAVLDGFQERFGVVLNEGYGLTEASPVTNWCRPQDHKAHSVGPALPAIEQRIVDSEGAVLGANEEGEIRIKGPNIMKGYYRLDAETQAAFDEDGFFKTGDIGRIDADGHLYITGRLKEMMVIGGENVFPRTIEEVLERHESVISAAVIGIPDASRGEVPAAFVELVSDAHDIAAELRAFCRRHLAAHQVPRIIRRLEKLPRSATGKILRRELPSARATRGDPA